MADQEIRKGKGFGFIPAGKTIIYLMRCFVCGLENYMPAVSSGVCAWCGYNANKKEEETK